MNDPCLLSRSRIVDASRRVYVWTHMLTTPSRELRGVPPYVRGPHYRQNILPGQIECRHPVCVQGRGTTCAIGHTGPVTCPLISIRSQSISRYDFILNISPSAAPSHSLSSFIPSHLSGIRQQLGLQPAAGLHASAFCCASFQQVASASCFSEDVRCCVLLTAGLAPLCFALVSLWSRSEGSIAPFPPSCLPRLT